MIGSDHTLGPWSPHRWTEYQGDWNITGADGGIIAEVKGRGGEFAAEDAANARLIAASPELLGALGALLNNPHVDLGDLAYQVREREGEGWDGPAVKAWSEAVSQAKAAIAKATGKGGA